MVVHMKSLLAFHCLAMASAFLAPVPSQPTTRGVPAPLSSSTTHQSRAAPLLSTLVPIGEPDLKDADMVGPPQTFFDCILKAYQATRAALDDGHKLLEVEFPPLAAAEMQNQAVSANVLTAANLQLATDFAQYFVREGLEVSIMVPDSEELELIEENYGTLNPATNVTIRSVRSSAQQSAESFGELFFGSIFTRAMKGRVNPVVNCDMYVCIVSSGQELPDLEQLHLADPDKPMVFFNLNLETHRGDLGLPAFASKDLHYRFLSKIKPVLFLRPRTYSLSLSRPPFILNYQGALFRVYPGGYQCLLDTNSGSYRRVETFVNRPALGEFKTTITNALTFDSSKVLSDLRKSSVQRTWWEKEADWGKEASDAWRT